MVGKIETVDNPYSPPPKVGKSSVGSRIIHWLLLAFAIMLILVSLLTAWDTLELANQEYLHLWSSRRIIYDIEINGSPISNADAIWLGVKTVLVQWGVAAALIVLPRLVAKNERRNED